MSLSLPSLLLGTCYAVTIFTQAKIYLKKTGKNIRSMQAKQTENSLLSTIISNIGLGWSYGTENRGFSRRVSCQEEMYSIHRIRIEYLDIFVILSTRD